MLAATRVVKAGDDARDDGARFRKKLDGLRKHKCSNWCFLLSFAVCLEALGRANGDGKAQKRNEATRIALENGRRRVATKAYE